MTSFHCSDISVCESFCIQQCDLKSFVFESRNMLRDKSKSYYNYLSLNNYEETFALLTSCSKRSNTEARKNNFYQYGSTQGSAKYPKFRISSLDKLPKGDKCYEPMLPRPVVCCRPQNLGWHLQKQKWLIDLVRDIETYTLSYLQNNYKCIPHAKQLMNQLLKFKQDVDKNLLICNSIFNQMIVIGELNKSTDMKLHIDKDDAIACILHLGKVSLGGSTNYYDGLKAGKNVPSCMNGKLVHSVPFEHGRLQIGMYKDIVHGVDYWEGTRITIDFNTKLSILNHYSMFQTKYTNQFKDAGYPSGEFCAK